MSTKPKTETHHDRTVVAAPGDDPARRIRQAPAQRVPIDPPGTHVAGRRSRPAGDPPGDIRQPARDERAAAGTGWRELLRPLPARPGRLRRRDARPAEPARTAGQLPRTGYPAP